MTLTVKQLALQIFTFRWPKKLNIRQVQVPLAQNWTGVPLDLWPISNNFLRWPPPLVLDDKHLDTFIDRWRT
jgi:acetylornithine/succinyldiaminopimelate/putrescine aminotransferase